MFSFVSTPRGVFRIVSLAALGALLFGPGCSGGHDHTQPTEVTTGSSGGALSDAILNPAPGTTFIPSSTRFRVVWNDSAPPPATYDIALYRYNEGCDCSCSTSDSDVSCSSEGSVDSGSDIVATDLNRTEDTPYSWELAVSDDDSLEEGGIYFVELNAGQEQIQASYIVSSDRSARLIHVRRKRSQHRRTTPVPAGKGVHVVTVTPSPKH